jgi:hypothetical protein
LPAGADGAVPSPCAQYGFFDDKVGPTVLCVLIMLSLTFILIMSMYDFFILGV